MQVDNRIKINNLLSTYGSLLTEKQKRVLVEYYELDLSLFEIAEQYNITRQAVRDTLVRATKQLEEYERKLLIVSRNEELRKRLDLLVNCNNCKDSIKDLQNWLEE